MAELAASSLEARRDRESSGEGLGAAIAGAATRLTPKYAAGGAAAVVEANLRLGKWNYGDCWTATSSRIQS